MTNPIGRVIQYHTSLNLLSRDGQQPLSALKECSCKLMSRCAHHVLHVMWYGAVFFFCLGPRPDTHILAYVCHAVGCVVMCLRKKSNKFFFFKRAMSSMYTFFWVLMILVKFNKIKS